VELEQFDESPIVPYALETMAARAAKKKVTLAEVKPPVAPVKKGRRVVSPRSAHRELWHRPELTGWTPERVESARQLADGGNLLELSDLVETLLRDDRVTGVMSTRTHGLLGLPVEFKGGSEKARECLAGSGPGEGEFWDLHDEAELVKLLTWGLVLGIGLAQRVELPRVAGRPHRYRIETWSPRWLSYFHQKANGTHWRVLTDAGLQPLVPGDGEWILFTPYGSRRPWAEGLWRAIAFPWLLKRFSLEDRANFSEVLGSPIWVGSTKNGATEKQRSKFLSQLRNLGKQGKIVLPEGWDMQLKEATGKTWEIFNNQIAWSDAAIAVALAGQLVTTEGTSGFSDGNIFDAIKTDLIRFDAERLATALRQQSLEPWARVNYGSPTAAPRPKWKVKRPIDPKERADQINGLGAAITALDAALKPHGLKVDAATLVADYDIPVKIATSDPAAAPAGGTNAAV
jgi:hypothetical protein